MELPDEASKATFKRLIAEARLLRGLCYFDLVRMWGDVPMKLTSSKKSENFLIPRTDREKVYDQIIEDMTAAVADLPGMTKFLIRGVLPKERLWDYWHVLISFVPDTPCTRMER